MHIPKNNRDATPPRERFLVLWDGLVGAEFKPLFDPVRGGKECFGTRRELCAEDSIDPARRSAIAEVTPKRRVIRAHVGGKQRNRDANPFIVGFPPKSVWFFSHHQLIIPLRPVDQPVDVATDLFEF